MTFITAASTIGCRGATNALALTANDSMAKNMGLLNGVRGVIVVVVLVVVLVV